MSEENDIIQLLQQERQQLASENTQLKTSIGAASYQTKPDSNLIEIQIETQDLKNNIEHFLKGQYVTTDEDGNQFWTKQENKDLILFNEFGVNAIMIIIGSYIDKNTSLSRYDDMRINAILADLGDELNKFLFSNYDRMGMDTEFKKARYGVTILMILHTIESTYRKAIGGRTMQEINQSRIVTQSDNPGAYGGMGMMAKKKFHMFKPSTW